MSLMPFSPSPSQPGPSGVSVEHPFALELAFTDTYIQNLNAHPAVREARSLQVLFPSLFQPLAETDLFAGRVEYRHVGFGLEQASGGPGYYCNEASVRRHMESCSPGEEERQAVEDMIEFWRGEATIAGRLRSRLSPEVREATENPIARMSGRLAGALVNYDKLVQIGIPGLIDEVEAGWERAKHGRGDPGLFEGMSLALGLLIDICQLYSSHVRSLAGESVDARRRGDLKRIADDLDHLVVAAPETLAQGIQLSWLYTLIAGAVNYGRMDIYLGDLYVRDVDSGLLSEDEALRLIQGFWQLIADRKIVFNGRVVIGGRGRRNEENADRFALAAMEATRTVIETEPQLSLRFYRGMNPALMDKALDVIGEGRTYPMLYNDDVNVPAVANAFQVPEKHAEHYYPYGCGEYALEHISFGSPNCSLNLLKALEATLHNGRDVMTGEPLGRALGVPSGFSTFEELFDAYTRQVEHHVAFLARRHATEYEVESESAAFLFLSMLYDGCMENGRSVVGRGPVYTGGIVESFGLVNTADALTAIKQVVYDKGLLTLEELVAALDSEGPESDRIRRLLSAAPKFGNDNAEADGMVCRVSDHVSRAVREQAPEAGLDYYLVVNINNFANVKFGEITAASADGRCSGEPLANGTTPTAGRDRNGVTAFLNSIAKVDPMYHAGYVHNMKFNPGMFREDRPKMEALLRTYFLKGGTQAMITVVGRGDLEAAMKEPEKHRNLIVRVGGFSARFVELSPEVQKDLLNRTLY